MKYDISEKIDNNFRNELVENFTELDNDKVNINGYKFNTIGERIAYLEKNMKTFGMPIDPEEEKSFM